MSLDPGTRLGSFEVLGPLGAGGMGEVYRASDMRLGREVALKILPEAFAEDPMRLARFEREARLLASVNHPGLAAIYGLEQAGPLRYIVMELVPGETLAEKLASGALPIPESIWLARQIAEALEAAHEKGIVHRDLKPSNIKVTPEGKVKVLDLGLAKAMDSKAEESDTSKSPTVVLDQTRPGMILGTAEFMSPEQARGKMTDKRTDIWAFGCILFEMLSGERVFTGETVSDIIAAILASEPDWTALPRDTPPRIRELIVRCLEKDANRRIRDIGDARMEIDQRLSNPGAPAKDPSRSSLESHRARSRAWALAAGVLAAAALVWLVWTSREKPKPPPSDSGLVVFPSRDLSGVPGGQLVGDGLVETLSARLGQLPGIQIVTPAAAVAASDSQSDPMRAAQSVGASLAVRSSFMRNGDSVRITYSVWNVKTRAQVAGGTVDGSASDLFGIQDRLVDRVAADLNLKRRQDRGGARPTPVGLEAAKDQESYLRAIGNLQRYDKAASVDDAIRILEALVLESPGSALVHAALGRAYLDKHDLTRERQWADRAFSAAEAARRLDPSLPEVDVTLGQTLLITGQTARAIEAFRRALAASPGNSEALVGVGDARTAAGDFAEAEASYRKAIALHPLDFAPYSRLGGLYYERGQYAAAAGVYRQLSRMTPDSYRAFSNLGGSLTMGCEFGKAAEAYERALELRPDHPSAASNLGMNQLWSGRPLDAVRSLEKASHNAPSDFQIWANLGDAYRAAGAPAARAQDAYRRSIRLGEERLALNARDAAVHSSLAASLARVGRQAEAESHMKTAVELDGRNPDILSDAAVVAALGGRKAEAVDCISRAIDGGYCAAIVSRVPEFASLKDMPRFRAIISAPRKAAGS